MKLLPIVLFGFAAPHALAQVLLCSPSEIALPQGGTFSIDGADASGGLHLQFTYSGFVPSLGNPPNFIVVIPSSGTTPASVQIGSNPSVTAQLAPGTYFAAAQFTTVDQTPPNTTKCMVTLKIPAAPPPSIQSVVNAASRQPLLAPGAQALILGANLTGPTLTTTYDDTAFYPTVVAGTSVMFNGIAAPLLYLSPGKIKAIVPFAL